MRFRLKSPHYIENLYLEEGVEIEPAIVKVSGNKKVVERRGKIFLKTPIAHEDQVSRKVTLTTEVLTDWAGPPSVEMIGLDPEAEKACEKRAASFMSINDLPIVPAQEKANV